MSRNISKSQNARNESSRTVLTHLYKDSGDNDSWPLNPKVDELSGQGEYVTRGVKLFSPASQLHTSIEDMGALKSLLGKCLPAMNRGFG